MLGCVKCHIVVPFGRARFGRNSGHFLSKIGSPEEAIVAVTGRFFSGKGLECRKRFGIWRRCPAGGTALFCAGRLLVIMGDPAGWIRKICRNVSHYGKSSGVGRIRSMGKACRSISDNGYFRSGIFSIRHPTENNLPELRSIFFSFEVQ